jgi:ribonuclease Z
MNAENILLTHFSARYPKMPPSIVQPSATEQEGPRIGLAFDHTTIRLGEFWKLNMYLPAIEKSFGDTSEEGDDEMDSRALRAGW